MYCGYSTDPQTGHSIQPNLDHLPGTLRLMPPCMTDFIRRWQGRLWDAPAKPMSRESVL